MDSFVLFESLNLLGRHTTMGLERSVWMVNSFPKILEFPVAMSSSTILVVVCGFGRLFVRNTVVLLVDECPKAVGRLDLVWLKPFTLSLGHVVAIPSVSTFEVQPFSAPEFSAESKLASDVVS